MNKFIYFKIFIAFILHLWTHAVYKTCSNIGTWQYDEVCKSVCLIRTNCETKPADYVVCR